MKPLSVVIVLLLIASIVASGCSSSSSPSGDGSASLKAPIERGVGMAETVQGKIYLIGGIDLSKYLDVVEEYDPQNKSWATKKPMPTARGSAESVVWNDEIYVIGGRSGDTILGTVEKYNAATDTWTTLQSMPTARWNPMIEAVEGKIYVIGGISGIGDNRKTLSTFEVYSIKDNSWSTLPDAPFNRQNGASAVVGDTIFIISGRAGTGEGSSTDTHVNRYSTASGQWATVPSLPEGRTGVRGAAVSNTKIVIAGGAKEQTMMPGVLIYSPESNRWQQISSLKTPRTGQCCIVIGNTLYVLSGYSSIDPVRMTTDVESFPIT